jgi:hypothetical protein
MKIYCSVSITWGAGGTGGVAARPILPFLSRNYVLFNAALTDGKRDKSVCGRNMADMNAS